MKVGLPRESTMTISILIMIRHERMKGNIRNTQNKDELSENSRDIRENKKILFSFVCTKMVVLTVQKYTGAEVHTIIVGDRELFWVKMIDVQKRIRLTKHF